MKYNANEIQRAKELCAEAFRQGKPRTIAVAAMVKRSAPERIAHVTHERTYRDYLVQARRELKNK